jgi:hypothetical protein
MRQSSWARYLLAALVVLIVGAIWVAAEEMEVKVEVRSQGGQEITIDVNGEIEVIDLEDLDDGESLDYEVGGHAFTVRRAGDQLFLEDDRPGKHTFLIGEAGEAKQVWVMADETEIAGARKVVIMKGGDGETVDLELLEERVVPGDFMFFGDEAHGGHRVIVIKGDDDDLDIEALRERFGDDFEETIDDDGTRILKWVHEGDGTHPIIIGGGPTMGEFVHYRCDETGSMLTVKKEEGLLDSYIDPVTGCLMERVDSEVGVHVITVREKVVIDEDHE